MAAWRVARHSHRATAASLDPVRTNWWDNLRGEPQEALGLYRPPWVGAQQADLDMPVGYQRSVTAETVGQLCKQGQLSDGVEALGVMVKTDSCVSQSLFYTVLKKCIVQRDLVLGRRVHALTVKGGYESDTFLCNHLLRMYATHARLQEAMDVFAVVAEPDAFTWSAVISAQVKHGQDRQAIELYHQMCRSGVKPDGHVFVAALQACARGADLETGQQVHAHVLTSEVEPDMFVCNCLVDMYAKCGSLEEAHRVFDGLGQKNVVTWTSLIAAYSQQGMWQKALGLYGAMQQEGMVAPDSVTFVYLLQACTSVGTPALETGKQLHAQIRDRGLQSDMFVATGLVNMYAKCGSLDDAQTMFDGLPQKDVVMWNAMIAGYSQQGMGQEALQLYRAMQDEGVTPDNRVTFVSLLQACASVGDLQQGKELHLLIRERGFEADAVIVSSLVNMYAKCGSLVDARKVFDTLPSKDVVTWNSMIAGYAQQGLGRDALTLYGNMQHEGITSANHVTFLCLLQACASVGALQQGKQLHFEIRERGLEGDAFISSCLVDMYSKCGNLEDAGKLFDSLPKRNLVTWNALLNGYAQNNDGRMAIQCFEDMLRQGVQPDETTFTCLLVACSHAGLVQEGQRYFRLMVEEHGIVPSDYPLSCMVDLLGRSGQLDEAEHLLRNASFVNDVVGWTALLTACKGYGDVERGQRCFDHLAKLAPEDASAYVLLGTIYANAGRWDDVDRIESWRKSAGAMKKAAKACIEVSKEVHEFTVGEERSDISPTLMSLNSRLKKGGHVPQTQVVLKAVSEQEKEDALCGHAEKLALAYGLLHTPEGSTLLVTKNLRMCNDCHSSTKIMSRLEKRDIVVRDAHRVHRFVDGSCSCGDRH